MQVETKELIYLLMNGALDLDKVEVPPYLSDIRDEFEDGGECRKLYDEVYQAKRRLARRLGVDVSADGMDNDLEIIMSRMNMIAAILSMKMFDCGAKIANRPEDV